MASTSLPNRLPHSVKQLIEEMDKLNPPATVDERVISQDRLQELIYLAGRRSVVDELLRLLERANDDG